MSVLARRIGMRDCLYDIYVDLAGSARVLRPWDVREKMEWFDAAVWLLGQVSDTAQRVSWCHMLALAVNQSGVPLALVVGELWRRVEARE